MQAEVPFEAEPCADALAHGYAYGGHTAAAPADTTWLPVSKRQRKPRAERAELAAVLSAIGQHDAQAFAQLYELTAASLLGVAFRIVRRQATAEEILQDAFTSIWLNAARYDPSMAAPFTWLVAIVRNRALDVLRHTRFEAEPDADQDHLERLEFVACEAPAPEEHVHLRRVTGQLSRRLRTLSANQQRALALAFFEDKSHAEVALAMAVPIGTAKTWIRRGLIELREQMGSAGAEG